MRKIQMMLMCIVLLCVVSSCSTSITEREIAVTVDSKVVRQAIPPSTKVYDYMAVSLCGREYTYVPLNTIEGFDHEEGFIYRLIVKRTKLKAPTSDGRNVTYELVKILSKTPVSKTE